MAQGSRVTGPDPGQMTRLSSRTSNPAYHHKGQEEKDQQNSSNICFLLHRISIVPY